MRPSRLSDRPGRRGVRFSLALPLNPRGDGGSTTMGNNAGLGGVGISWGVVGWYCKKHRTSNNNGICKSDT